MEHVPGPAVFDALAEAIGILRADAGAADSRDAIREAHMRRVLRRTVRDGFERIAVVCGAWHVPALRDLPSAAADDRLLRGLPKVKATLTWVPWTYGRLSYASGYGAGIRSPGWYDHLFSSAGQPIERWLARAAAVLRDEGIPVSSAHVIESVRLAEALAALRGRPLSGLEEVTEAARAVLCEGSDLLTALIQRRLVVGERLGTVPPATPMMPLQRDLQDQQRHLRLRPEAEPRDYDLDLRKPNDLARSRLLYRLALLKVRWGTRQQGRTPNIGTFRESWQLTWQPELDLALIEASMWGSTVAAAAAQRARSIAAGATALDELTALTEASQSSRRASIWRLTGRLGAGTSLWSLEREAGREERRGLARGQAPSGSRLGRESRAAAVRASQASRPPSATAPTATVSTAEAQKPVHRTSACERGSGDQADRSARTSVIRLTQPPPPGLVAEQPERHLRDVHRGDPAPVRRGQQRRARRAAGQVGHRPVGQVQRWRPEHPRRQRMGAEGRHEPVRVPGVPPDPVGLVARHEPGACAVREHERGSYGRSRHGAKSSGVC